MPGYVRRVRVWMFVWVYELTSASLGTSCSTMYALKLVDAEGSDISTF
jgi:hypothetical protein